MQFALRVQVLTPDGEVLSPKIESRGTLEAAIGAACRRVASQNEAIIYVCDDERGVKAIVTVIDRKRRACVEYVTPSKNKRNQSNGQSLSQPDRQDRGQTENTTQVISGHTAP